MTGSSASLLTRIKESLKLDVLIKKIKDSKEHIIDGALYGAIGFIAGFIVRRYFVYLLVFSLAIISILFLQQLDLLSIAINTDKVQKLFGVHLVQTADKDMMTLLWEWAKTNMVITVSLIVGFLFGVKMG